MSALGTVPRALPVPPWPAATWCGQASVRMECPQRFAALSCLSLLFGPMDVTRTGTPPACRVPCDPACVPPARQSPSPPQSPPRLGCTPNTSVAIPAQVSYQGRDVADQRLRGNSLAAQGTPELVPAGSTAETFTAADAKPAGIDSSIATKINGEMPGRPSTGRAGNAARC